MLMVHREPHAPEEPRFECRDCSYVSTARSHSPVCPDCGGRMRTARLVDSGS